MKKIQLELLGNCKIKYGGKTIDDAPRKVWILFECLYVNRDRYVSMDEISRVLWGDKKMANPANSIKVLVFELRNRLDEFGEDFGKDVVLNINGAYRLSDAFEYQSDADSFEKAARKAAGELEDESQRAALLDEAIALYKGNVILMDDECYWQKVIREHYAELFEKVVFMRVDGLRAVGLEKDAKSLCEKAYLSNPLSDALKEMVDGFASK